MTFQDKPPIPPSSSSSQPEATIATVGEKPAESASNAIENEVLSEKKPKHQSGIKSTAKKYWWLVPVLGVVVAIGGVTVARFQGEEPAAVTELAALSVRAIPAKQQPIRAWVSSEGTVRAVKYQHMTFNTEGDVTYLASRDGRRLREGDRVTQGELLARVDDRDLVADVRQAEAAVSEARQQQAAAEADVAQVQAQVAQARTQVQEAQARLQNAQSARNLAATNVDRYRYLVSQGAAPQFELDQRQNTLDDAESQIASARAGIESAQQQVAAAQAQVRAAQQQAEARRSGITTAQAQLSQARVALEKASIVAPFDGIVAYLNISEGEYFTPQSVSSQLGGDYQGILERIPMVIIDPSRYEVQVELPGTSGERVQSGQAALVASRSAVATDSPQTSGSESLMANARARGEVFAVNPAISPGGRAIEAKIRLNPTTTNAVRHGEQVLTWIAIAENSDAVVVPLNAVVRRDQVPYVFVVNQKGVVEQRQVELGITGITEQEIKEGVAVGELVVTEGQNRLVNGASVQVVGGNQN